FGYLLGPADGRYLVRAPGAEQVERVLALRTLGAPQRRLMRGRRGTEVEQAVAEPVPTSRATVILPEAFAGSGPAQEWLARLRDSEDEREAEIAAAVVVLNRALHAHRTARADGAARDVTQASALVVRLGFGSGEQVAEGRFDEGWELPRGVAKVKRSMEAPEERFAALLGGRESTLACEELVLRARADADAGRDREAALQARIALESLLSELEKLPDSRRQALEEDRGPVGQAANSALRGPVDRSAAEAVEAAVTRMEAALRAHRLGTGR
ncbi:MAG TPA: hypothetical protein VFY44_02035, partial [Thermoleophilaceae bacterium]|nr:hypothetical protein [Thermoleophilaceae bacterium]